MTHTRVVQMIKAYHDAYYNLRKSYNRDKEKESFIKKIDEFVAEAKSKLFDIAACKCAITYSCVCGKKASACNCPQLHNVIVKKTKKSHQLRESLCMINEQPGLPTSAI